jgi:hypothetical protein
MNKIKIKNWHIALLLILTVLFVYSIPRFAVCSLYHSIISKPDAFEMLSIKPEIIQIPESNQPNLFSIGFAETSLDCDRVNSIRYIKKTGLIVKTDSNDVSYYFLIPSSPDDITYDVLQKASSELPMSYFDVFFTNPDEMQKRILSTKIIKMSHVYNQNGIGFFETKHIKGIIRFGQKKIPSKILAEIYSKDDDICQTIGVNSESAEKSRDILAKLLSSYRFKINNVKDANIINDLIVKQFADTKTFEIDD